eukprot:Em0005g333a
MHESGSCVAPQSVGPKHEVDADGEVEHSTLELSSQVSETPDKQQEEDEGDSKSTIHTAIRVIIYIFGSFTYGSEVQKKKGVKTQVFSVGDKVTIGIPKMDRAKTDIPRLPCEITEVFGDKVKTYRLGTMFGTIKGNFRGGDLQSYDGSVAVVRGDITLSLREAAKKFNPCNKFTKPCCKCSSGCKTNRCICRKNGIQCSSIGHNATVCTNTQVPTQASRAPLLSPGDRAILDKTGWLSDMHMEAANVLLRDAFPAVDGLQNPILQQNMSFSVPSFEFVQFLLVNKNDWLVIPNIGEEMDTVMNVQLQDNGYACGELAVAFATSLIHGENPTQLHYKELRSTSRTVLTRTA